MAYADFAAVTARAGRFAGVFQVAGRHPDQTDVTAILADTAAELDAAIRSRGFDPAALNQSVKDALKDLNAYGALARALPAATVDKQADELADRARDIWSDGLAAIADGSFPAIAELEAGVGGSGGVTAGNFWEDEPTYPTEGDIAAAALGPVGVRLQLPAFSRGQKL